MKKCRKRGVLLETLKNLPETLDDTYARILTEIDKSDLQEARSALQWLAFSNRPLRVEEVAEAAVVIEVWQVRELGNEFGHQHVALADRETPQPHSIIVVSDSAPLGEANEGWQQDLRVDDRRNARSPPAKVAARPHGKGAARARL